ncbi:DUF3347 domain-containing protein [Coraliomargarita sp. W4R72]
MKKYILLALTLMLGNAAFAHSDGFKPPFVDTLVAPYLQIQTGLAGDDLAAAQKGATAYLEALKSAPAGEAAEEVADLKAPATSIASASEIAAARVAFLELSREVSSLIKHVGVTSETPLYVAHCPMAFSGKGGDWVQSSTQVANPYYGSMMFRCGSVKAQIAGKTAEAETHSHSGHSH